MIVSNQRTNGNIDNQLQERLDRIHDDTLVNAPMEKPDQVVQPGRAIEKQGMKHWLIIQHRHGEAVSWCR